MAIVRFTHAHVRHYANNGQSTAYVEWVDDEGRVGRTEGHPSGYHMRQLLARAQRMGVSATVEKW